MPVKLPKTHLPQLLLWLEQHLPDSFKVHGELKSHLSCQFPDLVCFVDRWPHPQAVVVMVDLDGGEQQLIRLTSVVLGVYGANDEALSGLLRDATVVDWNTRTTFSGVPASLRPVLKGAAEDMRRSVAFNPCYLLKATPQHVKPIPVPEGMKFRAISTAEIQIIDSTWKYASKGSNAYIQHLVQHFPSVFLVTENERLVGHMIGTSYGTMGMLHVNPEFRRKGYAKVIVSQLAQMYFDRGEDAYAVVEEDNPVSRNLHESLGFKLVPVCGLTMDWMTCAPKGSCQKPGTTCCV